MFNYETRRQLKAENERLERAELEARKELRRIHESRPVLVSMVNTDNPNIVLAHDRNGRMWRLDVSRLDRFETSVQTVVEATLLHG